jgi:hypothetical protein
MPMTSEKLRRSKKASKANRGQLSVLTEAPNAGVGVALARSSRIDNQQSIDERQTRTAVSALVNFDS